MRQRPHRQLLPKGELDARPLVSPRTRPPGELLRHRARGGGAQVAFNLGRFDAAAGNSSTPYLRCGYSAIYNSTQGLPAGAWTTFNYVQS